MAPRVPVIATEDVTSLKAPRKDVYEGARATSSVTLTLLRKCGMSAGVMASDAVGMFSYLFALPLLQVRRVCVCVCVCAVSYTHLTLPTSCCV